jgi:hypothetical protein
VVLLRTWGPWNCVYIGSFYTDTGIQIIPYLIGIWTVYLGIKRPVRQSNKLSPSNDGITSKNARRQNATPSKPGDVDSAI